MTATTVYLLAYLPFLVVSMSVTYAEMILTYSPYTIYATVSSNVWRVFIWSS